jgi:hypothetical protein
MRLFIRGRKKLEPPLEDRGKLWIPIVMGDLQILTHRLKIFLNHGDRSYIARHLLGGVRLFPQAFGLSNKAGRDVGKK